MKRKHIKYAAVTFIGLGVGMIASCKKSFLEVNPKGEALESDYYQTPDEAYNGLVAAYAPLNTETGGSDNTYCDPLGELNSAADECYAGGGTSSDESQWQAVSDYTLLTPTLGPQGEYWNINFTGVNHCNLILSKLTLVPGLSSDLLKRYTAEAKFLRAHYYFDLVRLFKNVPLIITVLATSDLYDQVQVTPDKTYAQIEADLTAAIPDLPPTVDASENGRVTQGAAKALLGKVYLYEKKYAQSVAEFADVNGTPGGTSTYGYHLQSNYGAIFSPSNKFNSESIFEIQHTGSQSYSWGGWNTFKSNVYVQMVGPRTYTGPLYYSGYSFNPIIVAFAQSMKSDPRYGYTIVNIDSLTKATGTSYQAGYMNTGYFIQKYAPLLAYKAAQGTTELNWPNDYIEIRLADTYLMEAEALLGAGTNTGRAQALLDAVRARVGLPSVPVTLTNIKNERKFELATEGHRWFDLVRWGDAPTVLAFKSFKAGTNEILPIPFTELANTKMVQNPGYH
jgi:hypothetical protein